VCDWDGTIVDSVEKITECKRFLAKKYSLEPPSKALVKEVLGTKFEKALARCFPTASKKLLNDIATDFHSLMQLPEYQSIPFNNAIAVLKDLQGKQGIILAIATSKARAELDKSLDYIGITDLFDYVCCSEEHQSKPDPEMLNYIMKQAGVTPSQTIMIGDTTVDMEFALNAKVTPIGVTFGAHSNEKLVQFNPLGILSSWSELPGILKLENKCIT